MDPSRNAAELVANAEGLILDFDGPVCSVFARLSSEVVSSRIRSLFDLPNDRSDPLEHLSDAIDLGGAVENIHRALTAAEYEAVRSATTTPGIERLLAELPTPVAIASNNAQGPICEWLRTNDLAERVHCVEGREPWHMKPDPRSLLNAATCLGVDIERCLFVGDSFSDLEAARRIKMPFVALANKASKYGRFAQADCGAVIRTIPELLA